MQAERAQDTDEVEGTSQPGRQTPSSRWPRNTVAFHRRRASSEHTRVPAVPWTGVPPGFPGSDQGPLSSPAAAGDPQREQPVPATQGAPPGSLTRLHGGSGHGCPRGNRYSIHHGQTRNLLNLNHTWHCNFLYNVYF